MFLICSKLIRVYDVSWEKKVTSNTFFFIFTHFFLLTRVNRTWSKSIFRFFPSRACIYLVMYIFFSSFSILVSHILSLVFCYVTPQFRTSTWRFLTAPMHLHLLYFGEIYYLGGASVREICIVTRWFLFGTSVFWDLKKKKCIKSIARRLTQNRFVHIVRTYMTHVQHEFLGKIDYILF